MTGEVERGRDAFDRHDWARARALLAATEPLDAADLERLAVAAHLVGRDAESSLAWERAQRACERARRPRRRRALRVLAVPSCCCCAARSPGPVGGWPARSGSSRRRTGLRGRGASSSCRRSSTPSSPAIRGRAADSRTEIVATARRFGDPDLLAFGLLCQGQAAIAARGHRPAACGCSTRSMLGVAAGEVSPIPTGIVYCAVIESCMDAFDLRRAAEWTEPRCTAGASRQPDLVPYRGQCLVHRSQVLQAHGAWDEAVAEADRARLLLSDPVHPALGLAFYQQGELHRLRGEPADADRAYRAALEHGREPEPGLALLRLAEGKVEAAVAAVRRMLQESGVPASRVRGSARPRWRSCSPRATSRARGQPRTSSPAPPTPSTLTLLRTIADAARGAVLLAEDDAAGALVVLRRACGRWRDAARCPTTRRWPGSGSPRRAARWPTGRRRSSSWTPHGSTFERLGARPALAPRREAGGRRHRGRPCSPSASARCCVWSRRAGATGRSPTSWSSARTRSPATCRTSSRRPGCPRASPPPRTPTSTTSL